MALGGASQHQAAAVSSSATSHRLTHSGTPSAMLRAHTHTHNRTACHLPCNCPATVSLAAPAVISRRRPRPAPLPQRAQCQAIFASCGFRLLSPASRIQIVSSLAGPTAQILQVSMFRIGARWLSQLKGDVKRWKH